MKIKVFGWILGVMDVEFVLRFVPLIILSFATANPYGCISVNSVLPACNGVRKRHYNAAKIPLAEKDTETQRLLYRILLSK